MKVYELKRTQFLPTSIDEAWDFFSSPANLKEITPDYLDFKITTDLGDGKMYAGQVITYRVRPLLGVPVRWMTEITHVKDKEYFVDEQRFGPYALWHHKHFFEAVEGGVEMTDLVHYAIPLWMGGPIAHALIVKSKLREIFDYRVKRVEELFGKI